MVVSWRINMTNFEWIVLALGLLFLNISWFALYYKINMEADDV